MDRRTFLVGAAALPLLSRRDDGNEEDKVDRIIRRLRASNKALIDFHIPVELFDEIERRSGIVICIN